MIGAGSEDILTSNECSAVFRKFMGRRWGVAPVRRAISREFASAQSSAGRPGADGGEPTGPVLDKIPSVVDSGLTADGFGCTSWFANRIPHKICWWQSNQTQNRPILTAQNRRSGITLGLGEFTVWALALRPES